MPNRRRSEWIDTFEIVNEVGETEKTYRTTAGALAYLTQRLGFTFEDAHKMLFDAYTIEGYRVTLNRVRRVASLMPKQRKLIAYEVVNRADPAKVDRIDLGNDHDYDGRALDGLLRQMNVEAWYVRNVYGRES